MKCEEYGRLVHLFLDGRLDEEEEKRLKDHLAVCERCAEKLTFLRTVEKRAKAIEPVEPPADYWDAFSGRVTAKIGAGRGRRAFVLKRALASLFTASSPRLRIAAGVVSIAVVVIVGALFLKERGDEIVPPRRVAEMERSPAYEGGVREERQDAVLDRSKRDIDRHAETPESDLETARTGVKKEKDLLLEETVSAKKKVPDTAEYHERPEGGETETAEMVVTELSVAAQETEAPSTESETITKSVDSAAPMFGRKTYEPEDLREEEMNKSALARMAAAPPGEAENRYALNGTVVYRIDEGDTAIPDTELVRLIEVWKAYVEENPQDSLTLHGYEQVATAYYLLAVHTRDEAVISEGSRLIEVYAAQTTDPRLRELLSGKLHKIRALGEK